MHGGSAPHIKEAARMRVLNAILEAADPAAARLIKIALKTKDDRVAISAIKEILDRAGIIDRQIAAQAGHSGQVLWEEFVALYRKRVAHVEAEPQGEPA
jgi:HEAT repeat protein